MLYFNHRKEVIQMERNEILKDLQEIKELMNEEFLENRSDNRIEATKKHLLAERRIEELINQLEN